MSQYNIQNQLTSEENYQNGLLPQRNSKGYWYQDSSSRSNLSLFSLSSENRRIFNKTSKFAFEVINLSEYQFATNDQKRIYSWIKQLDWDFPISSVKQIFTNHLFNRLYIWKNPQNETVAYSICYFSPTVSHIAYVFYNPLLGRSNLPIRLVLQAIQDSYQQKLKYCYLGRFSQEVGYYKRNMPGFEYFDQGKWKKL